MCSSDLVVFLFAARYNVSDNYVFFIPAHFILIILMTVYLNSLKKLKRFWHVILLILLVLTPLTYLILPSIAKHFAFGNEMEKEKWYKGGARFYFYPGMAQNPTSLDLGKSLRNAEITKDFNLEIEQNFEKAIWYYEHQANFEH